ncbi:MAG: acetaldehyde dehydrogenase (acetylating) [Proteobacteria bacterium]|nr:acetaldehyde dehydrogenase (acetylating) [Pseudomonadota bacterium]
MTQTQVAILGSGNIGTDLMLKVLRLSSVLQMGVLAGIDEQSEGLARARGLGVSTTDRGLDGLMTMPEWRDIRIVFDATSANAHARHDELCRRHGKRIIDLTPAAIGPYCVPVVNLDSQLDRPNLNMVTCGGQATIPIVHAVRRVADRVVYAEIVASMSSRSAGPGTRANIDEATRTTARGIEVVGGAEKGKAVIILNPAEPPLIMRNTVYILSVGASQAAIETSVAEMISRVQRYVPGYRLKHSVQFEEYGPGRALHIPALGSVHGLRSTVFLEVEGAAHYLPAYAGNLDIMTSAGLHAAERIAQIGQRQS